MTDNIEEVDLITPSDKPSKEQETLARMKLVEDSKQSLETLNTLVFRTRYFGEGQIDEKRVAEETSKIEEHKSDLVQVLKAWREAEDEFDYWRYTNPYINQADFWDDEASKFYDPLEKLITYGLEDSWQHRQKPLSQEEHKIIDLGGYGLIEKLAKDEKFEARTELLEFLKYDLWRHWISMAQTSNGPAGEHGPAFQANKSRYEARKELIFPLLKVALQTSAAAQRSDELNIIFEGLDNVGADREAENFIYLEGLTDEQRLKVAVEYINVFGFIPAIDSISKKINDRGTSDNLKNQLQWVYKELEGNEAKQIIAELTQIYQGIDFSQYALNNPEVTEREVGILEEAIAKLPNKEGVNKHDTSIVDIGAGVGRHSLELAKRGYKNITALEYEQKHVDYILQHNPDIRVIKGDWNQLIELYREGRNPYEQVDCAFILGRSITHNRTPSDMLHFFDQFSGIIKDGGIGVVDFEDIEWGIRGERIAKFRKNLEEKGVAPLQSGVIFDGPNDYYRFNRQILRPDQVKAITSLFGLRIIESNHQTFGEENAVRNVYYTLEKDGDFNPEKIDKQELLENMRVLGMLDPGADYDMYIDAWGMTVGQAIMFDLDDKGIQRLNESGRGPKVIVEFDKRQMKLRASLPSWSR